MIFTMTRTAADPTRTGDAFVIENGRASPSTPQADVTEFVNTGGGWDPTSLSDPATGEAPTESLDGAGGLIGIYFLGPEDADTMHWMLEIEGVTQGAVNGAGTSDALPHALAICAFPDVCFTPPENLSASTAISGEWVPPAGVGEILAGLTAADPFYLDDAAPADWDLVLSVTANMDMW